MSCRFGGINHADAQRLRRQCSTPSKLAAPAHAFRQLAVHGSESAGPVVPGRPPGGFLLAKRWDGIGRRGLLPSHYRETQPPVIAVRLPITGTISGQTVNLTAVAGPQTFALTGMLSTGMEPRWWVLTPRLYLTVQPAEPIRLLDSQWSWHSWSRRLPGDFRGVSTATGVRHQPNQSRFCCCRRTLLKGRTLEPATRPLLGA